MRYGFAVALIALVFSGCAIGVPSAPTGITDTGATLHAAVFSNVNGPTEAWFSYGEGTDPAAWADTEHETIDITTRNSYPLSAELTGLDPGTTYHWRVCARDQQIPAPAKVCSQSQTFTTDTDEQRYIAMGDSLTNTGGTQQYPTRFFNFLDSAGVANRLFNVGESGQTSGGLNGPQLTLAKQHIDDSDTDTTVLTIDIGGNDLLGDVSCRPSSASFNISACQPTIQTFATNFESTFDSLDPSFEADPGAEQVIAVAYFNPWSGRDQETAAANGQVVLLGTDGEIDCSGTGTERGFNDVIACTAAAHNAKVADMIPPFAGHGDDYFSDEIHPNDTGHQVMADVLEDVFQSPAAP